MTNRRTYIEIINLANNTLHDNNQQLRIKKSFGKAPCQQLILSNDLVVTAKKCFSRIFNKNKVWVINFDIIYGLDCNSSVNKIRDIKSYICSQAGKLSQQNPKCNIGNYTKNNSPWNKGKVIGHVPWNKGLTKDTNETLKRISLERMGPGNPIFGKVYTDLERQEQSSRMKKLIIDGTFTPKSTNRQTHFDYEYNNSKYRSSWELFFHILNPYYEYETLRIKYMLDNQEKIYIVDFVDHNNKQAAEIKPKSLQNAYKHKEKIDSLKIWCNNNDYTLHIIDENYIKCNIHLLDNLSIDESIKKKLRAVK